MSARIEDALSASLHRIEETNPPRTTMSYDRKTHHRRSVRLPHWDYSWSWWYYVTICSHDRQCIFGDIVSDAMRLSDVGKIVEEEWLKTPKVRPNVELDDYVIMPNHVHGIIIINDLSNTKASVGADRSPHLPALHRIPQSLGSILAGFKSAATKQINITRQTPSAPVWQRSYYEHIIRNDADLMRIRTYIANNQLQWSIDEENPKNIGNTL